MKRLLLFCLLVPLSAGAQFLYDGAPAPRPFSGTPSVTGDFRFAVAADRAGGERPEVFRRGLERIREYGPDFIVSVGDLIDGYTTDRAHANRQWDEFLSLSGRFGMPFFYVPGNHDYSNRELARIWEERFGRSYYSFRIGTALFLMLNSEELLDDGRVGISDRQADYFSSVLSEAAGEGPVFVVMHSPLWFSDSDPNYRRIEQLLLPRRNVMVFSGHTHRYYHADKHGWPHYNLATMGGDSRMRGISMGEFDHFLIVDVRRGEVGVRNISVDGRVIPLDAVDERSRIPVGQLAGEQWLQVIPSVSGEETVGSLGTDLVLTNPSDVPLRVSFEAPALPGGRFEPSGFTREVGGGCSDTIPLKIVFDTRRAIDSLDPIIVTCRGRYRISGREVAASAGKRWFTDCIRTCGEKPRVWLVDDPFEVLEAWDWHSTDDGKFRFGLSRSAGRIFLRIETEDDRVITDGDPQQLQDRLIVLFTPEGGVTRRIGLTAGSQIDDGCRACCRVTETGLEAELSFAAEGIRRFNLNIGFVDCDSRLNTKPSQLWWRPLQMHANGTADYGTFIMD